MNFRNRKNTEQVAIFNTGFFSLASFDGTSLDEGLSVVVEETGVNLDSSNKDTWNALVAVEGSFNDSNNKPHEFSVDRLKVIANNTNSAINQGIEIPVCTDHKKTVDNTVGKIVGEAFTRPISDRDLPNIKAKHLIGKMGLFFSGVNIKTPDTLEKVRQGVVNSVSMGLDLVKNSIVELSIVPIPAIPNMGLFSKSNLAKFNTNNLSVNQNAISWEELEFSEQSLETLKEDYDILTDNLWSLLNNLYNSDDLDIQDIATLKQYVFTILNGFSVRVVELLGLNELQDIQAEQGAASLSSEQEQQMMDTQYQGVVQPSQEQMQQGAYSRSRNNLSNFSKYIRVK